MASGHRAASAGEVGRSIRATAGTAAVLSNQKGPRAARFQGTFCDATVSSGREMNMSLATSGSIAIVSGGLGGAGAAVMVRRTDHVRRLGPIVANYDEICGSML